MPPFQLSAKEQRAAQRGGFASPPGTCPRSLITGSRWAVSSLIESPWGGGTAEMVKGSGGNTAFLHRSRASRLTSGPSHSQGVLPWAEEVARGSSLPPGTSPLSPSSPSPSPVTSAWTTAQPPSSLHERLSAQQTGTALHNGSPWTRSPASPPLVQFPPPTLPFTRPSSHTRP